MYQYKFNRNILYCKASISSFSISFINYLIGTFCIVKQKHYQPYSKKVEHLIGTFCIVKRENALNKLSQELNLIGTFCIVKLRVNDFDDLSGDI